MSAWRCPEPGCSFTTGDPDMDDCPAHGVTLVSATESAPSHPGVPAEKPGGPGAGETTPGGGICRHCGERVPHPGNTRCLACHGVLAEPPLLLRFDGGGDVEIGHGRQVPLGRTPESPAEPYLRAFEYASRLHAVVWIDADGRAWIRDEGSKNATTVNGQDLEPRKKHPLRDGDTVVMGRAQAAVKLTVPPP